MRDVDLQHHVEEVEDFAEKEPRGPTSVQRDALHERGFDSSDAVLSKMKGRVLGVGDRGVLTFALWLVRLHRRLLLLFLERRISSG